MAHPPLAQFAGAFQQHKEHAKRLFGKAEAGLEPFAGGGVGFESGETIEEPGGAASMARPTLSQDRGCNAGPGGAGAYNAGL